MSQPISVFCSIVKFKTDFKDWNSFHVSFQVADIHTIFYLKSFGLTWARWQSAVWTAEASCCNFAHTDASCKWSASRRTTDVRQTLKRGRWNPGDSALKWGLKVEEEITYISYSTALNKHTRLLFMWRCRPVLYVLFLPHGCSKMKNLFTHLAVHRRAARVCRYVKYRKSVSASASKINSNKFNLKKWRYRSISIPGIKTIMPFRGKLWVQLMNFLNKLTRWKGFFW